MEFFFHSGQTRIDAEMTLFWQKFFLLGKRGSIQRRCHKTDVVKIISWFDYNGEIGAITTSCSDRAWIAEAIYNETRPHDCYEDKQHLLDNSFAWIYQFYFHWRCPTHVTKMDCRTFENRTVDSHHRVFFDCRYYKIFCMTANRPREKSNWNTLWKHIPSTWCQHDIVGIIVKK